MSCPYYTWRSGYYCMKKEGDVNSDLYEKYCSTYGYSDCPIYKDDPSGGGCYLTSACVEAMGLPDDCMELTTLRQFRDGWLTDQPGGKETIQTYYRVAPGIVEAIRAESDSKAEFQRIYDEMVCPCVKAIQEGRPQDAWELYEKMTRSLEETYT